MNTLLSQIVLASFILLLASCSEHPPATNSGTVNVEQTNAHPTESGLSVSLSANGKTNYQQIPFDDNRPSKRSRNATANKFERFILSSTNIISTNSAVPLPVVAGVLKTNFIGMLNIKNEAVAGEEYLKDLKMQGRLPGMSADSHGIPTSELKETNWERVTFPFSVTIDIRPFGDAFTNHYTATQVLPDGKWQLTRAWRTDLHGKIIREWSVK